MSHLNGWDTDVMAEAVNGVNEQPESGKLTWRSKVRWDGGFGLDVHTSEIEQLGEKMQRHFTMRGDHPPELLGQNTGPTAIETFMAALGSCMAGTFAAQATARGVEIELLEVSVEGSIDLSGFFGLRPISPGVSGVQLSFKVKSDCDPMMLDEILEAAKSHSPIFDTTTRPVEISARVNRSGSVRPQGTGRIASSITN